ncbi:MAG: helix-turn-helix domain-containing protein [Bacteroidia bacterium]
MKEFFKYLSVGEEDKNWGLYLNVAGKAEIAPNKIYPSPDHPSGYFFQWQNGRVLQEFQLIYVTEGGGVLEDESGKYQIKAGTIMILRPGISHRYRPEKKSGWIESYIGFEGELAHRFLAKKTFADASIINCGIRGELIDTYDKIFNLVKEEEPGFQAIASGLIIKLLGYLISFEKRKDFSGKPIEKVIQKARFQMREQFDQKMDLRQFAEANHVGYAYLRKMFKKYTGLPPHQYHLELKIMKARELIFTTEKSIKEICFELGFDSLHYFSRLFKKKTGVNPSELRKNASQKIKTE